MDSPLPPFRVFLFLRPPSLVACPPCPCACVSGPPISRVFVYKVRRGLLRLCAAAPTALSLLVRAYSVAPGVLHALGVPPREGKLWPAWKNMTANASSTEKAYPSDVILNLHRSDSDRCRIYDDVFLLAVLLRLRGAKGEIMVCVWLDDVSVSARGRPQQPDVRVCVSRRPPPSGTEEGEKWNRRGAFPTPRRVSAFCRQAPAHFLWCGVKLCQCSSSSPRPWLKRPD